MIRSRTLFALSTLTALVACAPPPPATVSPPTPVAAPPAVASLNQLTAGAVVQGFVAEAVYTDDDGRLRGARFLHAGTGFIFDYLQIESAPQAMLYVTTYPTSDDGEPHTQEHLLLGKGNKGRYLGNFEHVMLAESNAFTEQYRTVYDFSTVAGVDAFWPLMRTQLDTLLHPDYTDDEIRREVRDYGTSKLPSGELELDEKGTVYNEMVRSSESSGAQAWWGIHRLLYGADHPLGQVSGGTPEGIRKLTPGDIRAFHTAHYQLGNMGAVGAFSASIPVATVLARVGGTLGSAGAAAPRVTGAPRFMTAADVPSPRGAAPGTAVIVDYPYATAEHAGPAVLAWPATRHLELDEREVLEAFLGAFGSGEGSTLYKTLVDQKTRVLDVGATGVSAWVDETGGQPAFVWVEDVSAAHSDQPSLLAIRGLVRAQLAVIAALPDGSAELAAFGERVKARVIEQRRGTDKFLDTPPQFGARSTGGAWIDHLRDVNATDTFRRSLTKAHAYEHALEVAGATKNPWRERIAAWGLTDEPYALMSRASPKERARLDDERKARIAAELARLTASYGVHDPKEALRRRDAEITEVTDQLARAEATVPMPPFWSSPPMTPDDTLVWHTDTARGIPLVASTFDTMKSVTFGLALRLDSLPEDLLPYLATLPPLLSDVGVIRDGLPISYEAVRDRLRREVLGVNVYFDVALAHDRAELVLVASGNDVDEARRALGWLHDFLTSPDWRLENLARIRDVVSHRATHFDDVMTGSEEQWAGPLGESYRNQARPLVAHAQAFMTRAYDAHRLSWMLQRDEGLDVSRVTRFLRTLAGAGTKQDRTSLGLLATSLGALGEPAHAPAVAGERKDAKKALPAALTKYVAGGRALRASDRALVEKAGADLGALLADIPDESVAADWAAVCKQMASDLERPATITLGALGHAVAILRHASGARAWLVGSTRNQETLRPDLDRLLATLDPAPVARQTYAATERVLDRARARGAATPAGATIALVNPNTGSTAIVNSSPSADLEATGPLLVDSLAASVFAGSGAQSLFKRIWASGLAYNGGIGVGIERGRISYYSDRIADPPQLVRLLSGYVRDAPADPRFVDYAVANAFYSRVGEEYESRAAGVASDLADGITADRVRGFRQRLLALRGSAGLIEQMHARFVPVLGALLPPLAGSSPLPAGALHFTIGPEPQLAAYEAELRASGGSGAKLVRIYPRDFWFVGDFAR